MRVIAGPACDKFGSRWVFGGMLLLGSLPIGLAPLVNSANGLYVSRFFIGILGGTFVPCQVWCTGFFDKNIVGTANALAGGWGNAGGGVTYFVMPAVFDAFVSRGYKPGVAWRLTFIVPLICIITCGIALLLLCDDTPTGKWSDRHLHPASSERITSKAQRPKIFTAFSASGHRTDKQTQESNPADAVIDPKDINAHLEAMLDRRNIPENQRFKMRNLNDTIKMEFIRQDWAEMAAKAEQQQTGNGNESTTSVDAGSSSAVAVGTDTEESHPKRTRGRSFTLGRAKKDAKSPTKKSKGE
ncbi:hypothetical protein BN1708_017522, partial [Verticillium longisporum]